MRRRTRRGAPSGLVFVALSPYVRVLYSAFADLFSVDRWLPPARECPFAFQTHASFSAIRVFCASIRLSVVVLKVRA